MVPQGSRDRSINLRLRLAGREAPLQPASAHANALAMQLRHCVDLTADTLPSGWSLYCPPHCY
eukprot:1116639-Rhodomonas_salina.1